MPDDMQLENFDFKIENMATSHHVFPNTTTNKTTWKEETLLNWVDIKVLVVQRFSNTLCLVLLVSISARNLNQKQVWTP
jgi:hypothetical protein